MLIGFGFSGTSFMIVVATFGKLLPQEWRSRAYGFGTAAGSFGQFLYSPIAVALMDTLAGNRHSMIFAVCSLAVLPLSLALATPTTGGTERLRSNRCGKRLARHSLTAPTTLLVLGFFTCGFQLAFITVHMPAYLVDRGLSATVGGWTLATIGLFNIVGSVTSGWLGDRMPKRYLLSIIYFVRAAAISCSFRFR